MAEASEAEDGADSSDVPRQRSVGDGEDKEEISTGDDGP